MYQVNHSLQIAPHVIASMKTGVIGRLSVGYVIHLFVMEILSFYRTAHMKTQGKRYQLMN